MNAKIPGVTKRPRRRKFLLLLGAVGMCFGFCLVAWAQQEEDKPKPIVIEESKESLQARLQRKITLDVRDMNIGDVIKFLAMKGSFNIVTSPSVQGRITLLLKSVTIKDALEIALISNRLAYKIHSDIIHVMTESEYQALYGKSFSDKKEIKIIHLQYAKPSYVLSALDNIKSSLGRIIIDEDTGSVVLVDTPRAIEEMKKVIDELEMPLKTFTYTLQYARADVVAEKLRSRLEGNKVGTILADERSNQLIVRAIPKRRVEIEQLIKSLDVKTLEVLIVARVLQIAFKPKYDMGIDWNLDFLSSADKELRKLTFKNVMLNEPTLSTNDNVFNYYGKVAVGNINTDHFETTIRALKQVSDTKILSNPKILVTNNQEARIHIGDTVPYIISTTSGTGDNAITSEDVRFVDVGLKLDVTPTINSDGFVTMRLKPEISTVITKIESKGGGIPQVNKTEVETTVMVKDGATVVLGGLRQEDKTHVKREIPFLGSLPFFGKFFSSVSDTISNTEIVIFLTPHIVGGDETYGVQKERLKPFKNYGQPGEQAHIKPLEP